MQFILKNIIAKETTMVLRMTGASWLATMMRVEREDGDRPPVEPAWLLDGPPDPEMLEALERLATADAR